MQRRKWLYTDTPRLNNFIERRAAKVDWNNLVTSFDASIFLSRRFYSLKGIPIPESFFFNAKCGLCMFGYDWGIAEAVECATSSPGQDHMRNVTITNISVDTVSRHANSSILSEFSFNRSQFTYCVHHIFTLEPFCGSYRIV